MVYKGSIGEITFELYPFILSGKRLHTYMLWKISLMGKSTINHHF